MPLLAALACGESGSNQASGGVGGSGVSKGPVSAFGSIFVTGIKWETDSAEVVINGAPASEADIQLGMVVTVEGDVDDGGLTGTATRVTFDEDLEGPIESITPVGTDGIAANLTVLGVEVFVEDGVTVFEDDGSGFDFASMSVNDVVEVSGLRASDGSIRATHIEREGSLIPGTTQVEIEGIVSNLVLDSPPGTGSFEIGTITILFGATTSLPFDAPPFEGDPVEVTGIYEASGDITATEIELEDDVLPDVDVAKIEGVITALAPTAEDPLAGLEVAGQPVDASNAALLPRDVTLYQVGTIVEVEGRTVDGILIARTLELRGFDTRIDAAIAAAEDIDTENGTFILLGITVQTDASTQFKDGVSLANLAAGDYLSVRGVENPPGTLFATRVKREEVDDVELRAFVRSAEDIDATAGTLTLLGITVDVNGAEFEDADELALTQAEFFTQVMVGSLVEVENGLPGDPTILEFATDVEFESPESGEAGLPPSFFPGVVTARPAVSAVGAMLDGLEAYGPVPGDELQRWDATASEDLDMRDRSDATGSVGLEMTEPLALAGDDDLSMVDAVVVFFDRIREVAADQADAAPNGD
jgi:hypothetical protein